VEVVLKCPPGASVTPLIVTSRLELRPFRPEDAAELHEIFSDPETHTSGEGPFTSLAQTTAWITRRAETEQQHGLLWYAACDGTGGRILGNCGLFAGRTGSDEPEIGYEIRRSCQGRGLATDAARAVLDDALASGIGRVWATIRPHNTASLRVAAKIGMTPRHTRPDSRGPLVYLARP
jgi:ribosomal-protein-alanine N-acetyltransferase